MISGADLFCTFEDIYGYKLDVPSFANARLSALRLDHSGAECIERLLQGSLQHCPTAEEILSCSWISPNHWVIKSARSGLNVSGTKYNRLNTQSGQALPPDFRNSHLISDRKQSPWTILHPMHHPPMKLISRTHSRLKITSSSGPIHVGKSGDPERAFKCGQISDILTGWKQPCLCIVRQNNQAVGPSTNECQATLRGHSSWVYTVAFSPDGKYLTSASADKTIIIWDLSTGAPQATLVGHSNWVLSVAFSPEGKLLASGSNDGIVKLWDLSTGVRQTTLGQHSGFVNAVAFSPDGKRLASGSAYTTIKLWDPSVMTRQPILRGHMGCIFSVAFSPDGKCLASASAENIIFLWDPSTGACQTVLQGHSDWVRSVTFSPDGKYLACGSRDRTVKLWDPSTGACEATSIADSFTVNAVAFSPDGKCLAAASNGTTIELWCAPPANNEGFRKDAPTASNP